MDDELYKLIKKNNLDIILNYLYDNRMDFIFSEGKTFKNILKIKCINNKLSKIVQGILYYYCFKYDKSKILLKKYFNDIKYYGYILTICYSDEKRKYNKSKYYFKLLKNKNNILFQDIYCHNKYHDLFAILKTKDFTTINMFCRDNKFYINKKDLLLFIIKK